MNCASKYFCTAKGLAIGTFIFIALTLGVSYFDKGKVSEDVQYETPVYIKDVAPQNQNSPVISININSEASNPLVYLLRILFWLFLISPPIIVVLLLVIISKMNKANKN